MQLRNEPTNNHEMRIPQKWTLTTSPPIARVVFPLVRTLLPLVVVAIVEPLASVSLVVTIVAVTAAVIGVVPSLSWLRTLGAMIVVILTVVPFVCWLLF